MKLLENILSTIDFSDCSKKVVENSIYLAKKFNSQVTLMHVIKNGSLSKDLKEIVKESLEEKLTKISNDIEAEGVHVRNILVEFGVPFEKIIHEAQQNDYNVIVAGAGSNKDNGVYKLGTTVQKLMRKNQIPLWVVKDEDFKGIGKIICPVDTSDASARALSNAIVLSDKFDAELTILNIYSPINVFSTRFEVDNFQENATHKARQEKDLYAFLENFSLKNINHTIEIIDGEPYIEILNHIKARDTDLLLMGTTGKEGLSKLLMGSVTEKVTREVPCSFITTKAKDITHNYFESNLQSVESILNSAKDAFNKKQYDKALEKYNIALKQHPDNIPVIMGLINTYKAIGNKEQTGYFKDYARDVVNRIWGDEYLDKFEF